MDRLNRLVGRQRAWLPDEDHASDTTFWTQYDRAEEVTRVMQKAADKHWNLNHKMHHEPESLHDMHTEACEKLGIPLPALTHDEQSQLDLLSACG